MALRVNSYTAWFILANVVLLAGCAKNPLRPSVPDWSGNPGHRGAEESIDKSKEYLLSQQTKIIRATTGAHGQDLGQKELALTGGVMAAAGQIASKTALLNSGLGIGTIALALNAFYQPREYMKRHLNALDEFNCLARTAMPLSDKKFELAMNIQDDARRKEVVEAPKLLNERIDDALMRYTRTVLELEPGKSSAADIQRFFGAFADDMARQKSALEVARESRKTAVRTRQAATESSKKYEKALAKVPAGNNDQRKKTADKLQEEAAQADAAAAAAEAIADADEAAVPFIGLRTRLEACHTLT